VSTIEELLGIKTVVRNRHADDATPSIRKTWHSPTSGGRSVGIVRTQTEATVYVIIIIIIIIITIKVKVNISP
jgi:hypothetical protein